MIITENTDYIIHPRINEINNSSILDMYKKVPPQCITTSSDEGSLIDYSSPSISRTNSSQSIPLPQKNEINYEELSPYEKTIKMLSNDAQCQKELALGKRVGFYRLGKELGCGNFSKVKLGVHVLTKEKVAIKIMERGKMDQKAQRVLNREIDNMELLHHPNIIRLFEVVSTLSKVHLVMEYAGGGELYTYVHDNGKLTEEVAKPIFAQIVSAVAHLHSKQICHRDIKAENVFLSHPGWIKLGDFGFSCKYQEDSFLNTFCGSPPYAAPELFRDQKYIGPMVDIWAMGILLYFMLVGVTPFRGETVNDLKRNILEGIYYMPDYVSTFAQHSITRMLELDARRRANIGELKRTYWLSECKFPDSYVNLSLNPNEHSLSHCKLERLVWSQLQSYGINEEMLRSVAKSKGARNPIIGTYRITLYQCQSIDRDKERAKLNEHLLQIAEKNNLIAGKIDERSKACILM
ncbi:Protein kinase domain-containing protein [Meloidogyne graminicola]|uniref:non-specific serine/threonine protein kinase n=1 Tax=Meloidogyne graminicola TaxID=189291 RepID=A0A8S9ZKY2_9BILA|nr:Protein kinase domain-containing protein [Meloidogyne graminicola]